MIGAEVKFTNLAETILIKPDIHSSNEAEAAALDRLIAELTPEGDIWLARAATLRHALTPFDNPGDLKTRVLNIYSNAVSGELPAPPADAAELLLEAARANLVFAEGEKAAALAAAAFEKLGLVYSLDAAEVKLTRYQEKPVLRISCFTTGAEATASGNGDGIEYVAIDSESQLDRPEFLRPADEARCTTRLTDLACIGLLLQAEIMSLDQPLERDSCMMPFVQRVTESADFGQLHWAVQARALYERSMYETADIEHIERGTLQLMKIAASLHAAGPAGNDRLRFASQLLPLSWRQVDDITARRLTAMSDFANALPFYTRLNQPLEMGMCYAAIGDKAKAMHALSSPELKNNPKGALLRGDLNANVALWDEAWRMGRLPEAKLRLAQHAAAGQDAAGVQHHLDELLEVYPAHYDALYLSGVSALGREDWEYAAKQLKRALAIKDDDPHGWSNLSTALVHLDLPDQALVALKQALRTDRNSEPDMNALANFTALSAQLGNYDDAVSGLSRLCELADRGAAHHVARLAGTLPRLVSHYVKQEFTGSSIQQRVVDLFRKDLPRAIAEDDATLARLTGKIEIWTGRYWAGLAKYDQALEESVKLAQEGGERNWMRVKLYATEYAEALEEYGDKEGRIEGSKACADWRIKLARAEKLIAQSNEVILSSR